MTQKQATIGIRLEPKLRQLLEKKTKERGAAIGLPDLTLSDFVRWLIATHPEIKGKEK